MSSAAVHASSRGESELRKSQPGRVDALDRNARVPPAISTSAPPSAATAVGEMSRGIAFAHDGAKPRSSRSYACTVSQAPIAVKPMPVAAPSQPPRDSVRKIAMPPMSIAAMPASRSHRVAPRSALSATNGSTSVMSIASTLGWSLTSCTRGTVGGKMLLAPRPSTRRTRRR